MRGLRGVMGREPLMEKFWRWLAWALPRAVVYHCMIRGWAHGTTGKFGHTEGPALSMSDALARWEDMEEPPQCEPTWPRDDMGREVGT